MQTALAPQTESRLKSEKTLLSISYSNSAVFNLNPETSFFQGDLKNAILEQLLKTFNSSASVLHLPVAIQRLKLRVYMSFCNVNFIVYLHTTNLQFCFKISQGTEITFFVLKVNVNSFTRAGFLFGWGVQAFIGSPCLLYIMLHWYEIERKTVLGIAKYSLHFSLWERALERRDLFHSYCTVSRKLIISKKTWHIRKINKIHCERWCYCSVSSIS